MDTLTNLLNTTGVDEIKEVLNTPLAKTIVQIDAKALWGAENAHTRRELYTQAIHGFAKEKLSDEDLADIEIVDGNSHHDGDGNNSSENTGTEENARKLSPSQPSSMNQPETTMPDENARKFSPFEAADQALGTPQPAGVVSTGDGEVPQNEGKHPPARGIGDDDDDDDDFQFSDADRARAEEVLKKALSRDDGEAEGDEEDEHEHDDIDFAPIMDPSSDVDSDEEDDTHDIVDDPYG